MYCYPFFFIWDNTAYNRTYKCFCSRTAEKYIKKKLHIGYIVREESVLSGENYRNGLVEIKTEGTKVSKGENVFRYYSNNEEGLKEQIAKLDIEIRRSVSRTNRYIFSRHTVA